jgi:NAD/NADP transhydrogenase beta subunit
LLSNLEWKMARAANDLSGRDIILETQKFRGFSILGVSKARTVVVIKTSLSPGFVGIPNPLFAADNTLIFFADAQKVTLEIIISIKEA